MTERLAINREYFSYFSFKSYLILRGFPPISEGGTAYAGTHIHMMEIMFICFTKMVYSSKICEIQLTFKEPLSYLYLSDISLKFCRCLELPPLLALQSPCILIRSCCSLPHCYSPFASSSCQDTCHSQTFQAFHLGLQKNKPTAHNITGRKLWFLATEKPLSSSISPLTANQHPTG